MRAKGLLRRVCFLTTCYRCGLSRLLQPVGSSQVGEFLTLFPHPGLYLTCFLFHSLSRSDDLVDQLLKAAIAHWVFPLGGFNFIPRPPAQRGLTILQTLGVGVLYETALAQLLACYVSSPHDVIDGQVHCRLLKPLFDRGCGTERLEGGVT